MSHFLKLMNFFEEHDTFSLGFFSS